MNNDPLDFKLMSIKAKNVNVGDHLLLKKSIGMQECRVIELTNKDSLIKIKVRDLYSLDYLNFEFKLEDDCTLIISDKARKVTTEKQILYRGHH